MLLKSSLYTNKPLILFGISLMVCVFSIHGFPIYILDEAKNAEAAREMLLNNTLIIPTFNDFLRTDKPPLHYFFMMLGYNIFGVNPFAARIFSSLFGALTLFGTYYFTSKHFNKSVAFITWIIVLSAVFFVQVFHQAVPDPYLIFFVSMGLFCFIDFYKYNKKRFLFMFYVFLGLGTLSKGPVAILLPGLIIAFYLFFNQALFTKKVFSYYPILGLLITFLIACPWFIAVHLQTDGLWTQGFFLDHNFNRFTSKMEGHGGVFLLTWGFVILGLLPFSVFIIQGLKNAWQNKSNDFIFYALVVSVVFIMFFSVSGTKLPNYTMPCYPFLALLIALYIQKFIKGEIHFPWFKASLIALLLISIFLPIGTYIAFTVENQLKPIKWLSLWLLVAPIGALISFYFFKHTAYNKTIASICLTWVLQGMLIFGVVYPKLLTQNPVTKSFKVIPKGSKIIAYKRFDAAFPFNYQKTFKVIKTKAALEAFLTLNRACYIITNNKHASKDLKDLDLIHIFEYKALFENHKTTIFKTKY